MATVHKPLWGVIWQDQRNKLDVGEIEIDRDLEKKIHNLANDLAVAKAGILTSGRLPEEITTKPTIYIWLDDKRVRMFVIDFLIPSLLKKPFKPRESMNGKYLQPTVTMYCCHERSFLQ